MMIIDTHQHLLYPDRFNYEWAAGIPALNKAFSLEDYWKAAKSTEISGTLFMEVDVPEAEQGEEAQFFCTLSEEPTNKILGVIASGRPENADFEAYLNSISHPSLKGIRRVFHTIEGELPISQQFVDNIKLLGEKNLSFDLCALPHQHSALAPMIEACPNTTFILDHCGIPAITDTPSQEWKNNIRSLAEQKNLYCKISGIIAYCPEGKTDAATLRPYFNEVVNAFGFDRLIFGGDWPVCNLTASLNTWIDVISELTENFTHEQKKLFFSVNASKAYKLNI